MNIDIVFFELHWKFDISRTIKLENGGGLVTEPLGALFQNVRLGGGDLGWRVGVRPVVCLSPRFPIHRVNFPKPIALPGPPPPLSLPLCIFINGIIASE